MLAHGVLRARLATLPDEPVAVARQWLLTLAPRDLARLGDAARRDRWSGGPLGPASGWSRVRPDVVWAALAALHPDGYVRERGVRALARQADPLAERVLALAATDHIEQVRDAAWAAVAARPTLEHAREVVPVLVAVRVRPRGAAELERYAALFSDDQLAELVPTGDRSTRVWLYHRLGLDVDRLEGWLAAEQDQYARSLLARALVAAAPERAGWLLGSARSDDRLVALWHLPEPLVPDQVVEEHLLGRSAGIREAARWRYRKRGHVPAEFYAAALAAADDPCSPRLLAGLREVGVPLDPHLAERLLADPRAAVRLEAVRGWPDPDPSLLLGLLLDPSPRVAGAAASRLGPRASYDDYAAAAASPVMTSRRTALHGRRGRGDWSRVRADLEVLADPELGAEALGDLQAWLRDRSTNVYSVPEGVDRTEILRMLDLGLLPADTERALRFCVR